MRCGTIIPHRGQCPEDATSGILCDRHRALTTAWALIDTLPHPVVERFASELAVFALGSFDRRRLLMWLIALADELRRELELRRPPDRHAAVARDAFAPAPAGNEGVAGLPARTADTNEHGRLVELAGQRAADRLTSSRHAVARRTLADGRDDSGRFADGTAAAAVAPGAGRTDGRGAKRESAHGFFAHGAQETPLRDVAQESPLRVLSGSTHRQLDGAGRRPIGKSATKASAHGPSTIRSPNGPRNGRVRSSDAYLEVISDDGNTFTVVVSPEPLPETVRRLKSGLVNTERYGTRKVNGSFYGCIFNVDRNRRRQVVDLILLGLDAENEPEGSCFR